MEIELGKQSGHDMSAQSFAGIPEAYKIFSHVFIDIADHLKSRS